MLFILGRGSLLKREIGILATKEATRKAFEDVIMGISWFEIEVLHYTSGRP